MTQPVALRGPPGMVDTSEAALQELAFARTDYSRKSPRQLVTTLANALSKLVILVGFLSVFLHNTSSYVTPFPCLSLLGSFCHIFHGVPGAWGRRMQLFNACLFVCL